jgi:hypothetical protein
MRTNPQRALRRASAKHSHTTHVSLTIHYPHHPCFGQTVTVVRRCRSFGIDQIQVVLPSGDQLVIPDWMLDEERCRGMEIVREPSVALAALLELRSLLDSQPLISFGSGAVVSEASSPGGARESTASRNPSVENPQQPGTSRGGTDALPGIAQSHAARSYNGNNRGEER